MNLKTPALPGVTAIAPLEQREGLGGLLLCE